MPTTYSRASCFQHMREVIGESQTRFVVGHTGTASFSTRSRDRFGRSPGVNTSTGTPSNSSRASCSMRSRYVHRETDFASSCCSSGSPESNFMTPLTTKRPTIAVRAISQVHFQSNILSTSAMAALRNSTGVGSWLSCIWRTRQNALMAMPATMTAASVIPPSIALRRDSPTGKGRGAASASVPFFAGRSGPVATDSSFAGVGAFID